MFAGLLVATLAGALFEVTRSFAILRIETKANASLQMAVFDRVLRLPLAFFRNYSAGDLAERANGINALRQALGGATLGVLLSGIVSLGNFVLLFYYSSYLALIATGILILNVAVTGYCSYRSMRYIRKLQDVAGKLSGLVLQLLTGIAKLRVSGAESRAFFRCGPRATASRNGSPLGRGDSKTFSKYSTVLSPLHRRWPFF